MGAENLTTTRRRGAAEDEVVLALLDAVERDPAVTQRSVARDLGIALGLANAYLRRCIRKGLIKVGQVPPRRYAYYLTPQGFSEKSRLTAEYLAHSLSFFRKARAQCNSLFVEAATRGHRRFALLGEGDLAEIASLVAHANSVEIAGIVVAAGSANPIRDRLASLGPVDAVMVTALVDSRSACEAAIAAVGLGRVYVPDLLRVGHGATKPVEAV
jgi:DNA-binding MarR family transcriptional regulator